MDQRLQGRAIIVVGAATGIGAATARRLAAEGARVCLADINIEAAQSLAVELGEQGHEAFAVYTDISDEAAVNKAVGAAVERLGRLDGAHLNAADLGIIFHDSDALSLDLAVFDRTIAVNLRGQLLCTRAVLPHLLAAGGGAIVYTSSSAAHAGEPVRPSYAVSKSGLDALMRHVASRWGKEGITANCVAPGLVVTPEMLSSGRLPEDFVRNNLAHTPHRRLGEVEDIAGLVAMLLSADGQWINGQVYDINGGVLKR
jgi:NAD(P)-dependent dehydrogenase (short-subunit alcohol dehydrogenase family)